LFNLFHARNCDREIGGRSPLRLLDEPMEHDRYSGVEGKKHPGDAVVRK
jgi:hypothetical protein